MPNGRGRRGRSGRSAAQVLVSGAGWTGAAQALREGVHGGRTEGQACGPGRTAREGGRHETIGSIGGGRHSPGAAPGRAGNDSHARKPENRGENNF